MSGGPSGFQNAPVTRTFIIGSTVLSVILGAQGRPSRFGLSYQDIFKSFRLWKLFSSVFTFSSTPELVFGAYLLYYFRVFERQIGSNKYSVFILFSTMVSLLLEILVLSFFNGPPLNILASGPYGLIFSSFVPFFFDIPVSSRVRIFGIPFSDKSFTYLAGLQLLLSAWKRSLLPGISGVVAGLLYRLNLFGIRRTKFPEVLASLLSRLSWPSSGGSLRTSSGGNGIRNLPSHGGRRQPNYATAVVEPQPESIATLVSMGFDTNSARQALIRARNDINVATNILLESQPH